VSRGGYVIGASYSNNFRLVKHEVAKNPQDILRFTCSKYVQSNMISALSLLKKNNNEKFLIIGTPCMICGVRKLIENEIISGDFILIDLFCHGVPSYLLWWAYLKYLEKRIGRILLINQRFKLHGWHNFATYVVGTEGIYLKTHREDPFMIMFLNNYFLRESCFKCPFRLTKSCADIRLGDFWSPFFHSDLLGVSLVLAYTDKGMDLLESSKDVFLRTMPIETIYASQPSRVIKPLNYEDVFKTLIKRRDLEEVLRIHFKFITLKNKIATIQSYIRNLILKSARNILFSKQV
jgi:coenzyme F420-reducing hydrogenase beta subunit